MTSVTAIKTRTERPIPSPSITPPSAEQALEQAIKPRAVTKQHSKPFSEANVDSEYTLSLFNLGKWATDAGIRSIARYGEIFLESPVLRIPFRAATEGVRKFTELLGFKKLSGEAIQSSDYRNAFSRIFENTISSAILEPSMYTSRLVRMGAGLANMGIRFLSRGLLFATKLINQEGLGLTHLLDEGFSRTVFRSIFADTANPIVRISLGFLEQLGINATVHSLPVINAAKSVKAKIAA